MGVQLSLRPEQRYLYINSICLHFSPSCLRVGDVGECRLRGRVVFTKVSLQSVSKAPSGSRESVRTVRKSNMPRTLLVIKLCLLLLEVCRYLVFTLMTRVVTDHINPTVRRLRFTYRKAGGENVHV